MEAQDEKVDCFADRRPIAPRTRNTWNPGNFKYTIERLEVYDGRFEVVDGTGTTDTYSYMSSIYLIKEDGRWQAIGSHVSGFRESKAE